MARSGGDQIHPPGRHRSSDRTLESPSRFEAQGHDSRSRSELRSHHPNSGALDFSKYRQRFLPDHPPASVRSQDPPILRAKCNCIQVRYGAYGGRNCSGASATPKQQADPPGVLACLDGGLEQGTAARMELQGPTELREGFSQGPPSGCPP